MPTDWEIVIVWSNQINNMTIPSQKGLIIQLKHWVNQCVESSDDSKGKIGLCGFLSQAFYIYI